MFGVTSVVSVATQKIRQEQQTCQPDTIFLFFRSLFDYKRAQNDIQWIQLSTAGCFTAVGLELKVIQCRKINKVVPLKAKKPNAEF